MLTERLMFALHRSELPHTQTLSVVRLVFEQIFIYKPIHNGREKEEEEEEEGERRRSFEQHI